MSDVKKGGAGPEHEDEDEGAPEPKVVEISVDAELDSISELLEGAFGEALGDLLGAPPPLPPPPEDQLMTSAPRPAGRSAPQPSGPRAPILPPLQPQSQPAPTDEEVFDGAGTGEVDPLARRSVSSEDEPFSENTRIAAVDEMLLAKARSAPPAPRRSPTIVRRATLPPRPLEPRAEEYEGDDSTRIADPGYSLAQVEEELAETGTHAPVGVGGPQIELDESFYDGIEIQSGAEALPAETSVPAPRRVAKTVTRNVVRRVSAVPTGTGSHSVPAPAMQPQPPPPASEPDHLDDPLLDTTSFKSKKQPALAEEAARFIPQIFEDGAVGLPQDETTGSSPLIDVLADFERVEQSGLHEQLTEPLSDDLSLDLEGGLDDAAWMEELPGAAGADVPEPPEITGVGEGPDDSDDDAPEVEVISREADYADEHEPEPAPEHAPAPAQGAEAEAEAKPEAEAAAELEAAPPSDDEAAAEREGEGDGLAIDVSGEDDVTRVAPMPRFTDETSLGVAGARLKLPAEAPVDSDDLETASVAELAELEQEIERAQSDPASAERMAHVRLAAGHVAERLGDLERAREHYDEALAADHGLAPAARAARRVLAARGESGPAVRYLEMELDLASPRERPALAAHRADLLLAAGEQDLARVAYGELADARPDDMRALLAQIELAWSDDRDDELRDALDATARHTSDPELRAALGVLRARLLEQAGQEVQAAAAHGEALEAHPGERLALLGLARLALRAGTDDEAAAHRARFLAGASDPSLDAAARRRSARAALLLGDVPRALAALEGVDTAGDPLSLEILAHTQLAAENTAAGAATLRAWADAEPYGARRAEVLHEIVTLTAGPLADPAAALTALREAAAADPLDADAAAELAGVELAAGNPEPQVALERAAGAPLAAARTLMVAGRLDVAISELVAAREAAPDSPVLVDALARALAAAGKLEPLAQLWREAAGHAACGAAAARERAARATEQVASVGGVSELGAAEAAWRSLLELEPDEGTAHAALLRLALARGDRPAAAAALAAARESSTDPLRRAAMSVERAALLATSGDRGAAALALAEALSDDPGDLRAGDRRATYAAAIGAWSDFAETIAERAEILPDGPAREALCYRAAAVLEELDELPRAAAVLAPALAARPDFTGAAVLLERLYRRLGDPAGLASRLEHEAGESTDATDPGLRAARLIRLAEVLVDLGELGRAAGLYREALGADVDDPVVRDGFARVATAAHEIAPLADLALADLKRAEEKGDEDGKVAAYEELARIDGDLRGDMASATLAWEAAAAIDAVHMPALRALERTYLGSDTRGPDLAGVYGKLGAALGEYPADAVPVLLEKARLHERAGQLPASLAAHREALLLGAPRMSLFRLEARARDGGALEESAALADRAAAWFAGDARAQAAFLTRAGEQLADAGHAAQAIDRFRAAADVLPGFVPALRALRRSALTAERWSDVVDAAEREAAVARDPGEKARLYHLAGVTAMDRAGDPERAARALRQVLAHHPAHDDAFRRLRRIFTGNPTHAADLAELLSARVEVEAHPGRLVQLHGELSALYRDTLGDLDRGKAHLRAVLTRDPRNLAAVTALADVAWGQGHWAEAAEALIQKARLEKSPEGIKDTFFRLGVIYDEKLPDRKWAMKSFERVLQIDPNDARALEHLSNLAVLSGEWRMALATTERLVAQDTEPAQRITHFLRIARILDEGFGDRKRGEDALRRAMEVDPTSTEALDAVSTFYARANDTPSLRITLDRVAGSMRARLARDPFDGVAYHVLARALGARAGAGVAGSLEAARCAAELAQALGAGDEADGMLAADAAAPPEARGLGLLHIDEVLFHPSISNGFRQIFRLLDETLSKRYPPDLRRAGVGKADKLPRIGNPTREVLARVALELGIGDFEVYVSQSKPGALSVELTNPVSVIVGSSLIAGGPPEVRFAAGRAMKLALSYMGVPASLSAEDLGVLLAAVIRQHDPTFAPRGANLNLGAVAEEAKSLARLIPKRKRDEIAAFATEISGLVFDREALWLGIQHTGNRAGLVTAGSVLAGASVLCKMRGHANLAAARGDAQIEELLRYSVSNEHCDVRAALEA